MAWEATYLLSPVLLLLLASGSWAQEPEVLRTLEGSTISVPCWYDPRYRFKEKTWCKETSEDTCQPLVSSAGRGAEKLRFSIQEHSGFSLFTVTMTELKIYDSGIYHCGVFKNRRRFIRILRTIYLVVSKGSSSVSIPDITPTAKLTTVSILVTTKYLPNDTTTTRSLPKSTAVVSSPDPGVTVKNGTDPTSVSTYSVVVPVVCGLLSKTLIFIVFFVVTQRSFG